MSISAKPTAPLATREKIFVEILRDLEAQRIVPGQRIAEGDLVERFSVSRNAVREGIQLLSERGVLDLSPNKSAVIRRFTWEEAEGVMDLCAMLNGLLARTAARNYTPEHASNFAARLAEAVTALDKSDMEFARARRHFTLALLDIAGNKELSRVFPMAGIAIFNAQFRSQEINTVQVDVFRHIHGAVTTGDVVAAEKAGYSTIENLRNLIAGFF